jgi:hypothetical protein
MTKKRDGKREKIEYPLQQVWVTRAGHQVNLWWVWVWVAFFEPGAKPAPIGVNPQVMRVYLLKVSYCSIYCIVTPNYMYLQLFYVENETKQLSSEQRDIGSCCDDSESTLSTDTTLTNDETR